MPQIKHENCKYKFKHCHQEREKASLRFHSTQNNFSSSPCAAQKNFCWVGNRRVAILDIKLCQAGMVCSPKQPPGWQSSNTKILKYQIKYKQCWLGGEKSGISGKANWFSFPQNKHNATDGMSYSHNRFRILQHAGLWSKRGHGAWSMQGARSPECRGNNPWVEEMWWQTGSICLLKHQTLLWSSCTEAIQGKVHFLNLCERFSGRVILQISSHISISS